MRKTGTLIGAQADRSGGTAGRPGFMGSDMNSLSGHFCCSGRLLNSYWYYLWNQTAQTYAKRFVFWQLNLPQLKF
jgi:hypothetical protein